MKYSRLLKFLLMAAMPFFAGEEGGGGAEATPDRGDVIATENVIDDQAQKDADDEAARIKAEEEAAAAAKAAGDEGKEGGKKSAMIPVERHKALLDKAREERDAMAQRLAQYEKGKQVQETNEVLKAVEDKVIAKEAEYNKLMVDGESEKATAVMREIRALERQLGDAKADMKAQAATAMAVERIRYDTVVERLEAAYPQLNPDTEEFDKAAVAEVMELKEAYELKGHPAYAALQKAVKLIMGAETKKQENAIETKPNVAAEDVKKAERTETATKKAIDAAKKTPPSSDKVGMDSDKAGGGAITAQDVIKMDQDKFSKLNEETLARLRGDIA